VASAPECSFVAFDSTLERLPEVVELSAASAQEAVEALPCCGTGIVAEALPARRHGQHEHLQQALLGGGRQPHRIPHRRPADIAS
jgi:hypothetical protein